MKQFSLKALTSEPLSQEGLEHAILQSLLNWSKAQRNDSLDPDQSKQGWWSTDFLNGVGCRDWTLARAKQTPQTLNRSRHYTEQALNWLITENIATSVEVSTWYESDRLTRLVNVTLVNGQNREVQL